MGRSIEGTRESKVSRRRFLQLLAASGLGVVAATGLTTDEREKVNQLGGQWIYPPQNAIVKTNTRLSVYAYPTSGYASHVTEVWFTLDPKNLDLSHAQLSDEQKEQIEKGHWIVLAKLPYNENNEYSVDIDFSHYGALPLSKQTISFDVYGLNADRSTDVNESPNGEHTITIEQRTNITVK